MIIPSAFEPVDHAGGRFESRPIAMPPDLPKNHFLGKPDEFRSHVGRLRAVALDICRSDVEREEAFRRLLAIEKSLWPNRMANEK